MSWKDHIAYLLDGMTKILPKDLSSPSWAAITGSDGLLWAKSDQCPLTQPEIDLLVAVQHNPFQCRDELLKVTDRFHFPTLLTLACRALGRTHTEAEINEMDLLEEEIEEQVLQELQLAKVAALEARHSPASNLLTLEERTYRLEHREMNAFLCGVFCGGINYKLLRHQPLVAKCKHDRRYVVGLKPNTTSYDCFILLGADLSNTAAAHLLTVAGEYAQFCLGAI